MTVETTNGSRPLFPYRSNAISSLAAYALIAIIFLTDDLGTISSSLAVYYVVPLSLLSLTIAGSKVLLASSALLALAVISFFSNIHNAVSIGNFVEFCGGLTAIAASSLLILKHQQSATRAKTPLSHTANDLSLGLEKRSQITANIDELGQLIDAIYISAHASVRWVDRETPDVQRAKATSLRIQRDARRARELLFTLNPDGQDRA